MRSQFLKKKYIDDDENKNFTSVTLRNYITGETHETMRIGVNFIAEYTESDGLNRFVHCRDVSSNYPSFPIVRPNLDTLYSLGVFDASTGPFQINLPPVGERYMSIECTNEEHYVEYFSKE